MEDQKTPDTAAEGPVQKPAEAEKAAPQRRARNNKLDRLVQDIQSAISKHERTSGDIQALVAARVRNLQVLKEALATLQAYLRNNGGVSMEHESLLRNLARDIGLNTRMTSSVVVAVNRAPALKNYKLIVGE